MKRASLEHGVIAQLGERYNGIVEVGGSIPPGSTKLIFLAVTQMCYTRRMKDLANYPGLERPKGRCYRVRVRVPRALIDAVDQHPEKWRTLLEVDKLAHRRFGQLTGKGGKLREVVTKSLDTSDRQAAIRRYHAVMSEYRHLFDFAIGSLIVPDKQPSDADIAWLHARLFSD
jgi:hypothetical protein